MRARLVSLGYCDAVIDRLEPSQAAAIIESATPSASDFEKRPDNRSPGDSGESPAASGSYRYGGSTRGSGGGYGSAGGAGTDGYADRTPGGGGGEIADTSRGAAFSAGYGGGGSGGSSGSGSGGGFGGSAG